MSSSSCTGTWSITVSIQSLLRNSNRPRDFPKESSYLQTVAHFDLKSWEPELLFTYKGLPKVQITSLSATANSSTTGSSASYGPVAEQLSQQCRSLADPSPMLCHSPSSFFGHSVNGQSNMPKEDYVACKIQRHSWDIIPLFLVIGGTLCNDFSFNLERTPLCDFPEV